MGGTRAGRAVTGRRLHRRRRRLPRPRGANRKRDLFPRNLGYWLSTWQAGGRRASGNPPSGLPPPKAPPSRGRRDFSRLQRRGSETDIQLPNLIGTERRLGKGKTPRSGRGGEGARARSESRPPGARPQARAVAIKIRRLASRPALLCGAGRK